MVNYRGFRDLKVYQLSFRLAVKIFELSKNFPKEEKYSLTDQIRRASRSVPTNISEACSKEFLISNYIFLFTAYLFNCNRLRKISWLVHAASAEDGDMVG